MVRAADEVSALVEAEVVPYVEAGDFMGVILIAHGEHVLFRRAYGYASVELQALNAVDTVFGIASISKYLTALAVVRLAEMGELELEDRLSTFLPGFPEGDEIQLRHLLSHTAGIVHSGYTLEHDRELMTPISSTDLVSRIGRMPRVSEPGAERHYSTAGYSILARVIEVVTGKDYEQAMGELVFEPAGMTSSGDLGGSELVANRAVGHAPAMGGGVRPARTIAFENKLGGGSLYTTVDDLLALHRALMIGEIVSPAGQERIKRAAWGGDWLRNAEHLLFGSNGSIDGYMGFFDQYEDLDLTVILLANVNTGAREYLRDALLSIPLGIDYARPAAAERITLEAPEILDDYLGSYRITPTLIWRVERAGDSLVLHGPGKPPMPLDPLGPDRFFLRARYSWLDFVRDTEHGGRPVTSIDWNEGGSSFPCPRVVD